MKELIELIEASTEDLPEIYCDLDEVLVDFRRGADAAVGGNFVKMSKDERWNKVNQVKGFWPNLGWKPNAKRLHDFIMKYNPHVLSAYTGRDPTSKVGKMKWLKKNSSGQSVEEIVQKSILEMEVEEISTTKTEAILG